jgi:hypothetical protein
VREIAAAQGVSTTTVYRWADPGFLERQNASARRWRQRNPERVRAMREAHLKQAAPRCALCARSLRTASPRTSPVLCRRCLDARTAEHRRRVGELFVRGVGTAKIAAHLGLPRGTVANDIYLLRARRQLPPARPQGFDSVLEQQLIAFSLAHKLWLVGVRACGWRDRCQADELRGCRGRLPTRCPAPRNPACHAGLSVDPRTRISASSLYDGAARRVHHESRSRPSRAAGAGALPHPHPGPPAWDS